MVLKKLDYTNPIDITLELNDKTILYPGDNPICITHPLEISKGEPLNMSEINPFNIHVGTHVDLPFHFLETKLKLEDYSLNSFMGEAVVCELTGVPKIDKEHIEGLKLSNPDHIILKTSNSKLLAKSSFTPDYCYLTKAASQELLKFKPKSIGFDYYSLDPSDSESFDSHLVFAEANIPVFVCLNLNDVESGEYVFMGTPIALTGVEASPVRALLFKYVNE